MYFNSEYMVMDFCESIWRSECHFQAIWIDIFIKLPPLNTSEGFHNYWLNLRVRYRDLESLLQFIPYKEQ